MIENLLAKYPIKFDRVFLGAGRLDMTDQIQKKLTTIFDEKAGHEVRPENNEKILSFLFEGKSLGK